MSSQIQITGETKVKSLTGVLVGTSGVVSSLNIDGSLGIPQLDVNGKILVSQLPNSVMEYKGTWDASTNTPTLANGTGNQGDVYLCNVAGTVNFGAGAIAFFVGDQVIYSGSIWQRASGATGTVTSVAVTESGDSLNITGSPITTSGTINIGFNGTNLQYVNGAGNLTTFPILTGYVTAVSGTAPVVSSGGTTPAISMAAATGSVDGYLSATDFAIFSAKQSALTFSSPLVNTSGTISIPAATTSVNGYLASADFTTFNNKQNAITLTTIGSSGVSTLVGATLNIPDYGSALTGYVTLATTQTITGAKTFSGYTTFTSTVDITSGLTFSNSGFTLVLQPPTLSVNRTVTLPNATGTLALTSDISYPVSSVFGRTGAVVATNGDYTTAQVTESGNLYFTDSRARLALSFVAGSGAYNSTTGVITIPTNNNQITNGAGYTTNVGTVTSVAALTIGTSGTDLSSTVANSTTTPVITLNVPTASAVNRGALSSADWSTFNSKQGTITLTTTGTSGVATLIANTLNIPDYGSALSGYVTLATTQTITGAKTFNTGININGVSVLDNIQIGTTSAFLSNNVNAMIAWASSFSGYTNGTLILQSRSSAATPIVFATGTTTATVALTLASTGAATFSSRVNVNGAADNASYALNVYGDATFNGTRAAPAYIYALRGGDDSKLILKAGSTAGYFSQIDVSGWNGTGTPAYISLNAGSGTGIYINNGNNVLIGTTTDAGYKLDVNGTGRFSDNLLVSKNQNGNTGITISNTTSGTGSGVELTLTSNSNGALGKYSSGTNTYKIISASTTYLYNGTAGDIAILNDYGSGAIKMAAGGSSTAHFTIASTGAATFSSSVTINGASATTSLNVIGSGPNGILLDQDSASAAASSRLFFKMNTQTYAMLADSNGLNFLSGATVGSSTGSPRMTITSGGNVLVNATTSTYGAASGYNLGVKGTSGQAFISIARTGQSLDSQGMILGLDTASGQITMIDNLPLTFATNNSLRLTIASGGGATFTSSVTATSFFESSDSRLKTLIQDNYQTKGIASITPKLYTKNGKVELGYYAQDFVGILDSAVSKGSDDMLSLSYREVLVAKVYALEQEIKELKAKLN